jgi:hypothetical protein
VKIRKNSLLGAVALAGAVFVGATNFAHADALGDFKAKVEADFKKASEGDVPMAFRVLNPLN